MIKRLAALAAGVGLLALVNGCGGGGGGGNDPAPATATLRGNVLPGGLGGAPIAAPLRALSEARAPAPAPCACGHAVVWFADGVSEEEGLGRLQRRLGGALRVADRISESGPYLIQGGPPEEDATRRWVESMRAVDGVQHAEPNFYVFAGQDVPTTFAPNDPISRVLSWNFDMICVENAWRITRGDREVVVAVVDSGVGLRGNPHPDLEGQLLPGYDFVDNDDGPEDAVGGTFHGTHVAGTIGAVANNSMGVAGVAPNVRLVPVRVLAGNGRGDAFGIAKGIRWAAGVPVSGAPANLNPADVINLSLGGGGSQLQLDAVRAARAAGSVVIAATGNDDGPVLFPAAYPEVIAVGSVGPSAERASYSNFGPEVDVVAPGGGVRGELTRIWSTYYDKVSSQPNYQGTQGTSMATPHVAAVAALMLSANASLTHTGIASILADTAIDVGPAGRDDEHGRGLIDAGAAVSRAFTLGGGTVPAMPASLRARGSHVLLRSGDPVSDLRLTSCGDGVITVSSVTAFESVDGQRVASPAWLSATVAAASIDASTDGIVRVTANVAAAGSGVRFGLLEIESSAGTLTLPVQFVAEVVPDVGTVIVQAIDALSGEVSGETTTTRAAAYAYTISGLAPGTYFVRALVDADGDGEADRLDEWSGSFPTEDRQTITVAGDETRSDVDFPISQTAEAVRTGTGGDSPSGTLAVRVRADESGLPIPNTRVILGNGAVEARTDERGIVIFTGVVGAQTVTAVAAGYDVETYVNVDASRIGFSLSPTRLGSEESTEVEVRVQGLVSGDVAMVFVGFESFDLVVGGDPNNPNAAVTLDVSGPSFVSVMVLEGDTGAFIAAGYGSISEDLLADSDPLLSVAPISVAAGSTLTVDTTGSAAELDLFLVAPALLGSSANFMAFLGLVLDATPGLYTTKLIPEPAIAQEVATVFSFGIDDDSGAGTIGLHTATVADLAGATISQALGAPPVVSAPADSGSASDGALVQFTSGVSSAFGTLELERQSDGREWTVYFGPGTTSVRLPTLGILTAGTYDLRVTLFGSSTVSFTTLEEMPASLREGIAVLDFVSSSETTSFTVP